MTKDPAFTAHPGFAWLQRPALGLEVYVQLFDAAPVVTMGESPFLNAKSAGISFALHADHSVRAVFLYAQGVEAFAQYAGPLPAGLSFASCRADVRAALGEPAMAMDAGGVGLMAIEHGFDRYEHQGQYVRFEYLPDNGTVRLVTLGTCED
jgi:hypothetical protein